MTLYKNNNRLITIIGFLPPPIGGVSIHVNRLLDALGYYNFNYQFFDIKKIGLFKLILIVLKSKLIHLHTASIYLRFIVVLLSKITGTKVIYTIHGNLGRFGKMGTIIEKLTLLLAYKPIVINRKSYDLANKYNSKVELISAFIPPYNKNVIKHEKLLFDLEKIDIENKIIYCTNASQLNFDNKNKEVYGIVDLINLFIKFKDKILIVSNPYGDYKEYLTSLNVEIPENITFIEYEHSFIDVIKFSNIFIRNTTTDGDSLSIKEALFYSTNVYATNVVDRPKGVIVYDNLVELERIILNNLTENKVEVENGFDELRKIYLAK